MITLLNGLDVQRACSSSSRAASRSSSGSCAWSTWPTAPSTCSAATSPTTSSGAGRWRRLHDPRHQGQHSSVDPAGARAPWWSRRRAGRPAGLPALEPGRRPAAGADHDRHLDRSRRPGDRPLQRGHRLRSPGPAGRPDRRPAAGRPPYSRRRLVVLALGVVVGAAPVALALPDHDRHGHPRRRGRPR